MFQSLYIVGRRSRLTARRGVQDAEIVAEPLSEILAERTARIYGSMPADVFLAAA